MCIHTGWQCPLCKKIHAPSIMSCTCNSIKPCTCNLDSIKLSSPNTTAKWELWGGWSGNHDQRIEGAKCSRCGYEHPTVYKSTNNLGKHCAGCGSTMVGVNEA